MQMRDLQAVSKQDKPAGTVPRGSPALAFSSHAEGSPVGLASVMQVSQESNQPGERAPGQEFVVLPISAVEAGLLSNQGIFILEQVLSNLTLLLAKLKISFNHNHCTVQWLGTCLLGSYASQF